MPPRRQSAKRKAATARAGDQDDGSDDIFIVANKKAKRSEGRTARRSPRLHSGDEGSPEKKGRASRRGRVDYDDDDDESEYQDGGVDRLNYIALQRKSSRKEVRKSKEFLDGFRKKQKTEEDELAEFARGKKADVENITKEFAQRFSTKRPEFLKQNSSPSRSEASLEVQPLYGEGRRILALSQEVLRHYNDMNGTGKGAIFELEIRSNDQDKKDVLRAIDKGRQLGEKLINASVSPSAGDSLATLSQPTGVIDELVTGLFEKSLGKIGEDASGKGVWGLWIAWDKVVKKLQEEEIQSA